MAAVWHLGKRSVRGDVCDGRGPVGTQGHEQCPGTAIPEQGAGQGGTRAAGTGAVEMPEPSPVLPDNVSPSLTLR